MGERRPGLGQNPVDVAPDLKTRAVKFSLRNYFHALGETPIGQQYPRPTIARVIDDNTVQVSNGTRVVVRESDVDMIPGKKVIIYKEGKTPDNQS